MHTLIQLASLADGEAIASCEKSRKALTTGEDQQVGTNDALAHVLMKESGLNRIYSFDKDFDKFKDINRIVE